MVAMKRRTTALQILTFLFAVFCDNMSIYKYSDTFNESGFYT